MGRRPFMLGRVWRDASAVAGGLRAAVSRPGPPGPDEDGQRRRDCQAEGASQHWRERRGRPPGRGYRKRSANHFADFEAFCLDLFCKSKESPRGSHSRGGVQERRPGAGTWLYNGGEGTKRLLRLTCHPDSLPWPPKWAGRSLPPCPSRRRPGAGAASRQT